MRPCVGKEPGCGAVELRKYEMIEMSEGASVLLPLFVRMTGI